MIINKLFEYYINGKNDKYDIKEINNTLPENDIIVGQVLKNLNNNTTKVIKDDDINGNYYVFLNDAIYLSNKNKSNKEYSRLTVICHECVHSIQPKILQIINFIFSNIEIIIFAICLIFKIILKKENYVEVIYITSVILSLIPRFILEIHASILSISLTRKYLLDNNKTEEEADFVYNIVKFQVIALLPFMLISLCMWKIVRILILLIL